MSFKKLHVSHVVAVGFMDAQQRRLKSTRNCAAESRSLDTGTKRFHLQGENGHPRSFTFSLYQEIHVIL